MLERISILIAALVLSVPLVAQVEPSATGGTAENDEAMTLPPQVSGSFYPSSVGDQQRANLLTIGLIVTAAYDDNVLAGESTRPVSAESYTVWPTITLSTSTTRTHGSLAYSPGFRFYDPTSELNNVTQSATADFQYRLTPRTTLGLEDVFQQNSTVFSQPYTVAGATVSGSGESTSPIVILPYAGQVSDTTSARIAYQFSRAAMIGASGTFTTFNFSNKAQAQGLYDSNSGGGTVFYDRRLSAAQYMGVSYRYSISESSPFPSTTENHYGSVFYTIYPAKSFSLSFNGGPEYSTTTARGIAAIHTWVPNIGASAGWHTMRTNLALSYSRSITTGWGVLGAFTADTASLTAEYEFTRKLVGSISGNYANSKDTTPVITTYYANGHSLFGRTALEYRLGEHLSADAEYMHLHQNYGIAGIANNPDDNRGSVSLNYRFLKPLGQ